MRHRFLTWAAKAVFAAPALALSAGALAQDTAASAEPERASVEASAPSDLSVTVYRDPNRRAGQKIRANWPLGFAMISETRTVTLPAGESTIRFDGVSEGMVAVSAIVSGLPGGTIEKNRNAELLSPAALVNGALGNRVTITRTNPASGEAVSQSAFVRTRADGGLVLETPDGFEAVRCAGLPEKLTFDNVPKGLSAKPVYSVNTRSESGGTYEVVLTYISWGFDWQANYVGTLGGEIEGRQRAGEFGMQLLSWLTLVNNNGQSFDDAQLLVVAGTINVESNFRSLAASPQAAPLRLTCYPIGSTSRGSRIPSFGSARGRSFRFAAESAQDAAIMVTGSALPSPPPAPPPPPPPAVKVATEENLGDLKLYRVPDRVNVSAKGIKQVAFLNEDAVKARFLYRANCGFSVLQPDEEAQENFVAAELLLVTKNEQDRGLGQALPQGGLALFEPSTRGSQLVAETDLRDYAAGQDIELEIGQSNQVFVNCVPAQGPVTQGNQHKWFKMGAAVTNANTHPVRLRLVFGLASEWDVRISGAKTRIKDSLRIAEITIPANDTRELRWKIRNPKGS